MRLVGRLLRALVALAVLVAVVAGVPALLATVGWPLPAHVPTVDELQRALSPGALTTDAVLKGLVVIGWSLWALVVVGSAVEAVAVLRHRQAPSLPGVRPFQGFARWLVTSLTLSLGGGLSAAAPVLAQPMAPPPAVVLALLSGAPPAQAAAPGAPAPVVAAPTYVVQRNDSLVGIAGAVLGDPDRWSEIFELNYGVPQPTGGSLRSAGVIRAGWVLQLPADARVAATGATEGAPAAALPEEEHVVRPGDNMWSIAEERVATVTGRADGEAPDDEVTPYWSEVVATNAPTVRSGDPNVIYAGEHLRLPGMAANGQSAPATSAPTPSPSPAGVDPSPAPPGAGSSGGATSAPTTAPSTTAAVPTTAPPTTAANSAAPSVVRPGVAPAPPATNGTVPAPPTSVATGDGLRPGVSPAPVVVTGEAEEAPPPTSTPARASRSRGFEFPHVKLTGPGLVGAGLLATGVVGALDRLIRARARRGRAKAVDAELAGSELALRVGADPEAVAFLDLGLRAMAGGLRDENREPPEVVAVELGPRQLEVILAEASTPAPPAFSTKDRGRRWVLPRRADRAQLEDLADDVAAPCPALVTVGRTDDGGWLLVDLEQAGAAAIVGERAMAREVLAAATVELATSEWADFVRLVLVGYGMAGQERVQSVASVAEVIDDLEREAAEIGALLAGAGCGSTFEARVRGEAADAWVPTVVMCAKPPSARLARRLAALATKAGNAGVAVLVAGQLEGAWELVVGEDEQLGVGMLDGVVVSAQHLSPEEARAVDALFQQAAPAFEGDDVDAAGFDDVDGEEETAAFYPDSLSPGDEDDDAGVVDEVAWQPVVAATFDEEGELADEVAGDEIPDDDTDEPLGEDGDTDERETADARVGVVTGPTGPPPGLPAELAGLRLLRDLDMLVGVLGPIEVWGAAKPFSRAKALELVVYLALHPRSAIDAERLMDALWPGWELKDYPAGKRRPTHSTLNTTTTVARDCLGMGPSGSRRLPHLQGNGTRRYRLEDVPLDYQLLRDAVARARAIVDDDRSEAKQEVREGLTLVRGRPFDNVRDDPRSYQWANANGAIAAVEREVCEAAHWLAKLCLDDHDPDGARWAARRGLLVIPGHRALVCDEMSAAALEHNPAGVEGAMRELAELLDGDDPVDSLDAHTVAVYKEQLANALRP